MTHVQLYGKSNSMKEAFTIRLVEETTKPRSFTFGGCEYLGNEFNLGKFESGNISTAATWNTKLLTSTT